MNIKRNFQKIKNIYHLVKSITANFCFLFPSRKLTVIGVTGTNGKTTTAQIIGKVLEATGKKVAVYSTINFKIGDKKEVNKTKFTTQSAWSLQKFINKALKNNCQYLVLETSSHALDQFRVWGVDYNLAVITNITREHLDYHLTMEDYRKTKLKLFKTTANSWRRIQRIGIVNQDMEKFEDFILPGMDENYLFSIQNQKQIKGFEDCVKIGAEKIVEKDFKSQFLIQDEKFNLNLPGKFNIENALVGICVGISQGISLDKIKNKLAEIKNIAGRMDFVKNKKSLKIIIDYALTPDSMEKIGQMMKEFKTKNKGRLIWVFGSCGNRDQGKRPIMGEIVSKFADYTIVTNEDPYDENPIKIMEEIEKGISDKSKEKFSRITDRKKALKKAFEIAKKGDIILVTGKGAEENMMVGTKKLPWNDKDVIQDILNN